LLKLAARGNKARQAGLSSLHKTEKPLAPQGSSCGLRQVSSASRSSTNFLICRLVRDRVLWTNVLATVLLTTGFCATLVNNNIMVIRSVNVCRANFLTLLNLTASVNLLKQEQNLYYLHLIRL